MVTQPAPEFPPEATLPGEAPETLETPAEEIQGETPPAETLEFWKAQAQANEARARKAEQDARSVQIGLMRQQERDELLRSVAERQEADGNTLKALIKSLGSGQTDTFPEEAERIEREALTSRAERTFNTRAARLYAELQAAVQDEEGKAVLDLTTAPDLARAREIWNRGIQARDIGDLADALTEVNRVSIRVQRQQSKAALEAERKAGAQRAKQAVESSGVNDMTTGRPAGAVQAIRNVDDVVAAIARASSKAEADAMLAGLSQTLKSQVHEKLGIAL